MSLPKTRLDSSEDANTHLFPCLLLENIPLGECFSTREEIEADPNSSKVSSYPFRFVGSSQEAINLTLRGKDSELGGRGKSRLG